MVCSIGINEENITSIENVNSKNEDVDQFFSEQGHDGIYYQKQIKGDRCVPKLNNCPAKFTSSIIHTFDHISPNKYLQDIIIIDANNILDHTDHNVTYSGFLECIIL